MSIRDDARKMKLKAPYMANVPVDERNKALKLIAESLKANADKIFDANHIDMAEAEANEIPGSVLKRLKFDEGKLKASVDGIVSLIGLDDPIGRVTLHRQLDEGLVLTRITCPIGVIGVIFEARPDALIQIASLCIKSGNCAILKGGKETVNTNKVLFDLIHEAVVLAGLPSECLFQATSHSEIDELLDCYGDVDLIIPRGSNAFVRYIMDNTRIPVMGHADGICHIYVDKAADIDMAIKIITDAKIQYTAACNAVETLLVHKDIADEFLPKLKAAMDEVGVTLKGDFASRGIITIDPVGEEGYVEYLSLMASVKVVDDIDGAITHINAHGSHHTDAIITDDDNAADTFMRLVDSAGVYRNCSTRFSDGFRYGFGAEVGISTSKLHARGPVGLDGLMTYKYMLNGQGQTVGEYASGAKEFRFRDL
ncbi:MAG: glutamate-5-semialdehyde dehydrogenase [Lachnospiraceae bacterium]|nr:glutamate-5-semialdehyde dehydrogenase [Lachnospiraceae bacterium]